MPGFEVEVIGTDPNVDRRLPAVAEVEIPFYAGPPGRRAEPAGDRRDARRGPLRPASTSARPGPPASPRRCSRGSWGCRSVGSYHTELGAYARLRSWRPAARGRRCGWRWRPSTATATRPLAQPAADESLGELGIEERGSAAGTAASTSTRFEPAQARCRGSCPGELNVLYVGRLTKEKGADLLADAFLEAHRRDPRLHLVLAGGGPEEERLWERLGEHATFLGWLDGDALARAYASADVFLFASRTDTFGQVILEAQASGLPVVAVDEGGPRALIDDGVTGLLCPPDAGALASAVELLASSPGIRRRIATGGRRGGGACAAGSRSLGQLADGYRRALDTLSAGAAARRAA